MDGLVSNGITIAVYVAVVAVVACLFLIFLYKSVLASLRSLRRLGLLSGAGLFLYTVIVAYYTEMWGIYQGAIAFLAVACIHIMLWICGVFNTGKEQ